MRAVPVYDVAVIGAGIVGVAIARLLSHHHLRITVIEATGDVGSGTTKANTAILHTGFDARPGSLEAGLVRAGHGLLTAYGAQVGIPMARTGALLVAWDPAQLGRLEAIAASARMTGYNAIARLSAAEVREREPHLGDGALGALEVPDEGIICAWTAAFALATEARVNGADFRFGTEVQGLSRVPGTRHHVIDTSRGAVEARWLVNAAGLGSGRMDREAGHDRFTVRPRRGQLIVFDKLSRRLLNHIILPVPTPTSKGVLVSPTVYGNVLLGPTAEEIADPADSGTTAAGLAGLLDRGRAILPALVEEEITAVYAGVRAATEHSDYQVHIDREGHYAVAGGIRSTGVSSSMALADHVVRGLADSGLRLQPKPEVIPVAMANIGETAPRPYQLPGLIADRADYGQIICHCERVTRGEILDALASPLPPRDLDGLRRRTRVLMGRCQGFFCLAAVATTFADAGGPDVRRLLATPPP